jgi:DNA-binding response OmpR family regulator
VTQPAKGILETILLVEDDPAILKMVKLILEGAGFGVLSATSANEASLSGRLSPGLFIYCCRM